MGTDEIFKKKKKQLDARKHDTRTPKPNSFLIVSEGAKTEPLYFDGLSDYINQKYGKGIDVEKPIIDTCGEGKCTVTLVNEAERIVSRSKILYSQVWVLFDKDDFQDFDEAIELGEKKGFKIGWSNQSFEFWIYLHFNYCDSALHRDGWVEKLNKLFKQRGICGTGYQKNNKDIFSIATTFGSLKAAVRNAAAIEQKYGKNMLASACDPCTQVHHLMEQLSPYIEELL